MTISPRARNRLSLVLAAFLFSTGGAAIKFSALTAWQIAGFRSAVAGAVIALLIPGARRGWSRHTLAVGVSYAATLILFVAANKLTTSANAIFLQSTAPLYLLFIGPIALREKTQPSDVAVFAAIALGGALLLHSPGGQARTPASRTGDLVAACSGFTWAWTIAGLSLAGQTGSRRQFNDRDRRGRKLLRIRRVSSFRVAGCACLSPGFRANFLPGHFSGRTRLCASDEIHP